ncbi:SDR family NAD(P)-dependent oxidoreductase [Microbacterium koreense]|uniref:SDR family NAD(P)-dependent oxidoreductase n=1 Tax=Microbacterium koreense TaxID=323761 RepID=A0ABW2ZSS9_9MICO
MQTTPTLTSELLAGKVALVTGGGQGIGRATAESLAANGATVCIADVDEDRATEARDGLGRGASMFIGDLTAPDVPNALIDHVISTHGQLDIIVNAAGYFWDAPVHRMTDEQFQAMLDIHLLAPFRLLRAAAPHFRVMPAEGGGSARKVVNVSSLAASFGNPGAANYAAAKAGLEGLTKTLASEWGPFNVTVNAVAFGIIQTRFGLPQSAHETITVGGRELPIGVPDKTLKAMGLDGAPEDPFAARPMAAAALGRTGTIQEAADAILWLASPLSDFVTGQVVPVSGGARGGFA